MNEHNYIGKWELGCIVVNSVIYKILTGYSKIFTDCGGAAAWITAAFYGIVFLILLKAALKFYEPCADEGLVEVLKKKNKRLCTFVCAAASLYFIFSGCYAVRLVCNALKEITYVNSPVWFLALFFIGGAAVTAVLGERAVRRIHSLTVLGTAAAIFAIIILSLGYSEIYNIFPVMGSGAAGVFGRGAATLYLYSDIILIFFLPRRHGNYSYKKTVMNAARIGVLINVLTVLAVSLNISPSERLDLPVYPLTKTANIGKMSARLDAVYQIALIVSVFVYLSLIICVLLKNAKHITARFARAGGAVLCIVLCVTLCGCYDAGEVEESAYAVAIGIDKGNSEAYRYTFQISNPLESGDVSAEEPPGDNKTDENKNEGENKNESEKKSGNNKTADSITVEANDYFTAADKLKSILSKNLSLSHLKLIVFSKEAARDGALGHSELMLREREVRPGTNLCLAESAQDFLTNVKPTLEESTVRYYELYFKNYKIPYAPVTQLRDFVGRCAESGFDAVIPTVKGNSLEGMGIFSEEKLQIEADAGDVLLYKLLMGELKEGAVETSDGTKVISSCGKPRVEINENGEKINISVKVKSDGKNKEKLDALSREAEEFLSNSYKNGCDVIGIGRRLKKNFLTQKKWMEYNWRKKLIRCSFSVNIYTK